MNFKTALTALLFGSMLTSSAAAQTAADARRDAAEASSRIWLYVATTGSDGNPGTAELPFRTVQRAVNAARAGTTIMVQPGTYQGVVKINGTSGTPEAPIVLRSAINGTVTLTATHKKTSCAATAPTRDRTVQVMGGADYWTIKELNIAGGVMVAGYKAETLDRHVFDRSLPGRSVRDFEAAARLLPQLGVDPSDAVRIMRNKVTGRGIQVLASRFGRVVGNEVSQIECGTGAGILLSRFSDGWYVRENFVHHNSASVEHPMEEGVRLNAGSGYNVVQNNLVEDLVGRGRGFSTDVHTVWNTYVGNTARRVDQGFNEQTGGWGNLWLKNRAESVRSFGFNIDGKDHMLPLPDDGVPAWGEMRENCSVNNPDDLNVGAVQQFKFEENSWTTIRIAENPAAYWTAAGNVYDGSTKVPTGSPAKPWCS